ncbi:MAG TPA: Spy/CpxP family protein refolding chaperone [Xanthobacteraceae bacterium]|nr:Spy/CpxP family protein refolding chaperone [Xanthobacteraceae bacterium]
MLKAALVGAFALATVGSLSISSQGIGIAAAAAQEVVVTEAQIGRLHAALHLTPAQERHWYPVAATLRRLGHAQARYQVASADEGFVARARARVAGYTVTAMTMQRLRTVAQPLIAALSEEQKNAGRGVLASMGVSF